MKKYLLPILAIILFSCNDDLEGNLEWGNFNPALENIELIEKDQTLYTYLGLVSKNTEVENTDVGCIEFIYPFVLFRFDAEDEYVNQVSVSGNENFSEILDGLEEGYSIGLSYPISGNLIDGTPVEVNNNEDLQKSLETCIEEALEIIIGNCNSICAVKNCVWKVTESDNEDSPYIDSFFTMRADGSVVFSVFQENSIDENEENSEDNNDVNEDLKYEDFVGTWIFYFIGADLHMNINFGPIAESENGEETESDFIKSDWNFDWKIDYIDLDKIEIEKMFVKTVTDEEGESEQVITERITLEKECEEDDDTDDS